MGGSGTVPRARSHTQACSQEIWQCQSTKSACLWTVSETTKHMQTVHTHTQEQGQDSNPQRCCCRTTKPLNHPATFSATFILSRSKKVSIKQHSLGYFELQLAKSTDTRLLIKLFSPDCAAKCHTEELSDFVSERHLCAESTRDALANWKFYYSEVETSMSNKSRAAKC